MDELVWYGYCHMPFCAECGQYFDQCAEVGLMILKCGCKRERVLMMADWKFIDSVGYGIGMSCMIHRVVDLFTGDGTDQQKVDAFVRLHFGDQSECDKDRAVMILRELIAKKIESIG